MRRGGLILVRGALLALLFPLHLAHPAHAFERIISLKPSLTEILFALGLGDRVVGVTTFCNYPPEAEKIPKIGGYASPVLEKILALKPDLVVLVPDATPPKVEAAIRRAGIETLVLKGTRLDDVFDSIEVLARKMVVPSRGERLVTKIQTGIKQAQRRVRGRTPRRTVIVVQRKPLIVAGGGTFLDDLLTLAHAENIVDSSSIPYPRFSTEVLLRRMPEVIIDMDVAPVGDFWDRYSSLPAVREGKIFHLPPGLFGPGTRLSEALSLLIEKIHGV